MPIVIDTMVFDAAQITSPTNGSRPQWGGHSHSLSGEAGRSLVIIKAIERNSYVDNGNRPGECRNNEGGVSDIEHKP